MDNRHRRLLAKHVTVPAAGPRIRPQSARATGRSS